MGTMARNWLSNFRPVFHFGTYDFLTFSNHLKTHTFGTTKMEIKLSSFSIELSLLSIQSIVPYNLKDFTQN